MTNLDEIYKELKEVHKKISSLCEWRAKLDERCENRGQMISDMRNTVYGNPNPESGLAHKVERLLNCKRQTTDWRNFWSWILRIVIASTILAIIGWSLGLYKKIGL